MGSSCLCLLWSLGGFRGSQVVFVERIEPQGEVRRYAVGTASSSEEHVAAAESDCGIGAWKAKGP